MGEETNRMVAGYLAAVSRQLESPLAIVEDEGASKASFALKLLQDEGALSIRTLRREC